jgi:hypothetical protein
MSIPTQMSLVGFVASAPELHFTKKGDECCRLRVGVEQWRKEVDGSFTKLVPTFHEMVAFESTAERPTPSSVPVTPSLPAATSTSSRWSAAAQRASSRRSSSPRRSDTTPTRPTTSSSADVTPPPSAAP